MNFFKAFYLTGATTVLVTIISFFNNVFVTRFLGAEGRGKYSIVMNIVMILSLIFGEGLRRGNVIFVGRSKANISRVVARTLIYTLVLVLFFLPLVYYKNLVLVNLLKINFDLISLALYLAAILIFWRALQSIFLGIEDYNKFNIIQLAYTSLFFTFNVIVIYFVKAGLTEIILSFFLSSVIVSVISLFWIKQIKSASKNEKSESDSKGIIIKATLASIFGYLLLKGDIFLVNYFTNNTNTGIYSITLVITDLFQKLPLILGPIVIARSVNKEEKKEVLNIAKMSRVLVLMNFLAILFIILFGREVISILFSNQFDLSFELLIYILPALLIFSSGHIINAFFMGQGFPFIVILNSLLFSIINIIMNIIFIPKFGVVAAAINCSLSYILWSITFIIYFSMKYDVPIITLLVVNKKDILELRMKLLTHG